MSDVLSFPLMDDLIKGEVDHATLLLVEFEPHSIWHDAAFTLAKSALSKGIRVDFHTFTRKPSEVRNFLTRLGLNVIELQDEDRLRIIDSYTPQTGLGAAEKAKGADDLFNVAAISVKLSEWPMAAVEQFERGIPEPEKRRLHIDDDLTVIARYNTEDEILDFWRTRVIPLFRARESVLVNALATGVASDSFIRRFEALSDGIIDFRSREEGGKVVQYERVRTLHGKPHDSDWRRLVLSSDGLVRVEASEQWVGTTEGERRLAAIMFTDMVGYTALGQKNEALSLAMLQEQRKLIRPILLRRRGKEIKTMGDAFLVEFSSGLDAVRCAYDIQRATKEFNVSIPEDQRIHLRIGIHLGDVVESEGDVSGDTVNLASRIEPLAEDGGICLTRQVHDDVRGKIELEMKSLGQQNLKNVSLPVEIFKVVMPWSGSAKGPESELDRKRVAVLPFKNMSPDPNDEYFADGMTEELITNLSKVGQLTVIARTSVMTYKNTPKRISDISRELGVGTLIEGSVRKASNRVRISVQLLDSKTEGHVWAENYDRDLRDIFEVQSDVARQVSEVLRVKVLPSEKNQIEKRPTTNAGAHILYLKGRFHWNERTPKSTKIAAEYFEKTITEDPSFALAYVGLADTYMIMMDQGAIKPVDAGVKIKSLAEKALELDPTLAEAHATLGGVFTNVFWDWRRAEAEFQRSIELNPAYPTARQWYAKYLSFNERFEEALEQHRKALQLDPFSLIININNAEGLVEAGRYSEGINQALKTLAINPDFALGHYNLGQYYVHGSEFEKAVVEFKKTLEIIPGFSWALASLGHVYALMGRKAEATKSLEELREASKRNYISPALVGLVEFSLGRMEEAFKHIEQAHEERSNWILYFKVFPGFENIRADERFKKILKRMGFSDKEIRTSEPRQ
jgi:adenylate cyclase